MTKSRGRPRSRRPVATAAEHTQAAPGVGKDSGRRALRQHRPAEAGSGAALSRAAVRARLLGWKPGPRDARWRSDLRVPFAARAGACAAGARRARARPGVRLGAARRRRSGRGGAPRRRVGAAAALPGRSWPARGRDPPRLRPRNAAPPPGRRATAARQSSHALARRPRRPSPLRRRQRALRPLPRLLDDLQLRPLLARCANARGGSAGEARPRLHQARLGAGPACAGRGLRVGELRHSRRRAVRRAGARDHAVGAAGGIRAGTCAASCTTCCASSRFRRCS